jgi:transposase
MRLLAKKKRNVIIIFVGPEDAPAGVPPFNHDSGALSGQRRIGVVELGCAAFCTWLRLPRSGNPVLKAFYQRLRETGKPGKVALVAAIRKLLLILNAMIKTNTAWRIARPVM